MALPPQNDEAFLREVDEELRRDQIGTFWRRYGRALVAAVLVGLALFGAWLWWQDRQQKAAAADSEILSQAIEGISAGRITEAEASLGKLASDGSDSYRTLAKLTLAARMVEKGDARGAVQAYDAVAADGGADQVLRDLALIRSTAIQFDTLKPQQVIDRLKPLAEPGNPWFGSAGEMTAIAQLKAGQPKMAVAMFEAVAKDEAAPRSVRDRAERIALALGGTVSAPAAAKE